MHLVSTRQAQYPYRLNAHLHKKSKSDQKQLKPDLNQESLNFTKVFKKEKIKPSTDPGGKGIEIEKEIQVCSACYEQLNKKKNRLRKVGAHICGD